MASFGRGWKILRNWEPFNWFLVGAFKTFPEGILIPKGTYWKLRGPKKERKGGWFKFLGVPKFQTFKKG